jgi:hypothetical protein
MMLGVKRAVLLLLSSLVACSPRPGTVAEVPGQPAPSAGTGVLEPVAGPGPTAPSDPRLVRCGVDDTPRSVISGVVDVRDGRLAKRMAEAIPADRAMPPPALVAPPGVPLPPPVRPTRLAVGVAQEANGGPVEPAAVAAGRALTSSLETCVPMSTEADLGDMTLHITVAASGAPLWALPASSAQPSVYGRCLLEHACGLKLPGLGTTRTISLPVQTSKDPPPPPPQPRPTVNVRVTMDPSSAGLADVGRSVLEGAGRACASQARLTRETRFRVTLSTARGAEIATSSPDGSSPARDPLVACAVAQIEARIPPKTRGSGFSGIIRWEP